ALRRACHRRGVVRPDSGVSIGRSRFSASRAAAAGEPATHAFRFSRCSHPADAGGPFTPRSCTHGGSDRPTPSAPRLFPDDLIALRAPAGGCKILPTDLTAPLSE